MARSNTQDTPVKVNAQEAATQLPEADAPAEAFVRQSIQEAGTLLMAKADLLAQLQRSRDFLDYAVTSGQATAEQAAWIAEYLPKRTRGGNDDES